MLDDKLATENGFISGLQQLLRRGAPQPLISDNLIENHGNDDDRPSYERAAGRVEAKEDDAACDHLDDQHSGHDAEHSAMTAGKRCASDYDSRDCPQHEVRPLPRRDGPAKTYVENAGKTSNGADENQRLKARERVRNSGKERRIVLLPTA